MLELEPVKGTRVITDQESGATFTIKPLPAEKHSSFRKSATKDDSTDLIVFGEKVAKFVIADWTGVALKKEDGEANCNEVTKAKFGRRFAYSKMPWIIDEAMKFDQELAEEVAEAKKD